MKLIEPKVELITEKDPFKKIEIAGRTCYKSEKNITDDSAIKFYSNLVKHQHTAMLEHANIVFEVSNAAVYDECCHSKFLHCTQSWNNYTCRRLVSGNIRAINESENYQILLALFVYNKALVYNEEFLNGDLTDVTSYLSARVVDIDDYNDLTDIEILHHKYLTMRFTCDRGVTHELVRHRLFSFAQESTRYVNYAKQDMQFIEPANYEEWTPTQKAFFIDALKYAEHAYNTLVNTQHLTPQQARAVLPNAIKTEIIVTGNVHEWTHFFNLRYFGTTGKPHPVVAEMAYEKFTNS